MGEKISAVILTARVAGEPGVGDLVQLQRFLLRATTFSCASVSRTEKSLSLLSIKVPPWSDSQGTGGLLPRNLREHRAAEDSSELDLLLCFELCCSLWSTMTPKGLYPWMSDWHGLGWVMKGCFAVPGWVAG